MKILRLMWGALGSKELAAYTCLVFGLVLQAGGNNIRSSIWIVGSLVLFHMREEK